MMFKQRAPRQFWCLVLSLVLLFEPLVLAAEEGSDKTAQEQAFTVGEALSPGEYLEQVKKLRGADQAEVEKNSYSQWATIMTNVFVLLDPNATDVPSYQSTLGSVLDTEESVRGFVAGMPDKAKMLAKITTWGQTHFSKAGLALSKLTGNILKSWKWIGDRQASLKIFEFAKYMRAPSGKAEAAAFQQWLYRKPPTEGVESLTKLKGAATVVGTVIQILQGIAEIKSFFNAKSNDPGAVSWGTVSHAVEGALLIATAVMALIPPPGVWAVAAVVIMLIWDRLKDAFNKIGEKIQKWHKVYEDSQTFMKEQDKKYSAFLSENQDSTRFGVDQEKSASLVFADQMQAALKKEPGEGDIAKRQKELVQNMRNQGLLTTWFYQQATAARQIPSDKKELYTIWNHRADYMAWKPKKPGWHGFSLGGIGETLGELKDFAIDTVGQEILGTDDQMKVDLARNPNRVHFCPDFALIIYYRNFITHKRVQGAQRLPPLLSLVGARIEQAPFNYIPLVDIYSNNFSSWTDEALAEGFAADTFNVGVKELPVLKEQVKATKDEFENGFGAMLAKMQTVDPDSDMVRDGDGREMLMMRFFLQMEGSARMRAELEGLLDAYLADKNKNIKDLKVKYTFNGKQRDFKLVDELFDGKEICPESLSMFAGPLPPFNTGLLKDEEKPRNEDRTPAKIFEKYKDDLALSLQLNVNSLGITGVDVVQMGTLLKGEMDLLALAKMTRQDRQEAFDTMGAVFKTEAFKRLLEKGEYLDVNRGGLENFFSGYDPPKDVLKHEIGKFKEAIEDVEDKINERKEHVEALQKLVKEEYGKWLAVLKKYEEAKDEIGITLDISASDPNYRASLLDFYAPLAPLDPNEEVK